MKPINIYLLSRASEFDLETFCRADRVLSRNSSVIREHEKHDLRALSDSLISAGADVSRLDGFYYSYDIPQIGKEFDLLKLCEGRTLNIELKHEPIADADILAQLDKNRYYLAHLGGEIVSLCFVARDARFVLYDGDTLSDITAARAAEIVAGFDAVRDIDIDAEFKPSEFLVSPLTEPQKFLRGEYFLTNHQNDIKKNILRRVERGEVGFFEIKGGAGTGKTLLLYDLARTLCERGAVCVIHCGILCDGHDVIHDNSDIYIASAKGAKTMRLDDFDFILVDESHRIYGSLFDRIAACGATVIFSLDRRQFLTRDEETRDIACKIDGLDGIVKYELTNKIRTNKELATFIVRLFDLAKRDPNVRYDNVDVLYAADVDEARLAIEQYKRKGYEFINFTPSRYDRDTLDDFTEQSDSNTHRVIGQEFDSVVMFMDDNFYYDGNLLRAKSHPCGNYIYTQLLYQGLTRVRNRLCIVVLQNAELYKNVLRIADNID